MYKYAKKYKADSHGKMEGWEDVKIYFTYVSVCKKGKWLRECVCVEENKNINLDNFSTGNPF